MNLKVFCWIVRLGMMCWRRILFVLSGMFSNIAFIFFVRTTFENTSFEKELIVWLLSFCVFCSLFQVFSPNSTKKRSKKTKKKNKDKLIPKELNTRLSSWEKERMHIRIHWYTILFFIACILLFRQQYYVLSFLQLLSALLQLNNDLRDGFCYKIYWKSLAKCLREMCENSERDWEFNPVRYGILYRDDTEMVPVTFSRGGQRSVRMLVFDWETEIAPYIEQEEDFNTFNMKMNCRFCIYVIRACLYSKEELNNLLIECINRWQYQISTWVYLYLIGDSKEDLETYVEKFAWMPEVKIYIVRDAAEIRINDVVEHYEQQVPFRKDWLQDKPGDKQGVPWIKFFGNYKVHEIEIFDFFEYYLKKEQNDQKSGQSDWEKILDYIEIIDFIKCYSRIFLRGVLDQPRTWIILYWMIVVGWSVMRMYPNNTLLERLVSVLEDDLSYIIYPFGDPCALLEELNGKSMDEGLTLENRERILYYINANASLFYRYIPYQEEEYPDEVYNYHICGFFKNMFRLSEPKMAIMAGFDYADMALRFVLYYFYIRNDISPEELVKKRGRKNTFFMDLQLMGDEIYKLADKDDGCPIYDTVVKTGVITNTTLDNALLILQEFLFINIRGEEMNFSGLVELLRVFRNATKGHGVITEKNQQQIWYALYVLLVILGDMLRIYNFQIDFAEDGVYTGYKEDEQLYHLGMYIKNQNGFPCPLYEASITKGELENRHQVAVSYSYINYWEGTLWKPSILP